MPPGPIPPTPRQPGNRIEDFAPAVLRDYIDCPERFYRAHIGNERVRAEFSRPLLRGSAVHKTLARHFTARQDGEIIAQSTRDLVEEMLPAHRYRSAAASDDWEIDVELAVRLVEAGLARVPEDARVLEVETTVSHILSTTSPATGARIAGKVDLVILHTEGIVEHIEWKTGGAQPDPIQEVICRIGVVAKHGRVGRPVLSTVYQLTTGQEWTLDGDRTVLASVLPEIENAIASIWTATEWPAHENDRCGLCDFRTTLCSLHGEWSTPNRLAAQRDSDSQPAG